MMADLDDFFAKKDRKKKTKKGFSIANTDILAKNLEENDRKEAKAEEKCAVPLATSEANKAQAANDGSNKENDEEEWKTFDDDKKDYSNLKIDALKVDSGSELEEDEEHEMNDEGEMVRVKKVDGGPWNKIQTPNETGTGTNCEVSQKERREAAKADLESSIGAPKGSVVGGSYVPPHMRSSSASSSTPARRSGMANSRRAKLPDINSQVYFPSLSSSVLGGPGDDSSSKYNEFEEVKSGNTQHTKSEGGPQLSLDNKFSALRD